VGPLDYAFLRLLNLDCLSALLTKGEIFKVLGFELLLITGTGE